MSKLSMVVSVILFAVGALLMMFGVFSFLTTSPPDVSEATVRVMNQIFRAAGVIGIMLIALGVYVRTRQLGGRLLLAVWAIYACFLVGLLLLTAFVWSDMSHILGESGDLGQLVVTILYLVAFLAAPLIEVVARRQARNGNPSAAQ